MYKKLAYKISLECYYKTFKILIYQIYFTYQFFKLLD